MSVGLAVDPAGDAVPGTGANGRVLAVTWRGLDRYKPFHEAVMEMSHHRFGSDELDGDFSASDYLRGVALGAIHPTTCARTWSSDVMVNP